MPRIRRLVFPGGFYHLFNRGLNRKVIFPSPNDYLKFLGKLFDLKKDSDFIVYAYALLPNHFHFLMETGKTPLAKIMGRLLTSYGVYFNKKYQKRGPLFEDRYKSILIQKDSYFLQLSRYIHLNPVKAGLANNPAGYVYSSFAEIIGKRKPQIIDKKKVARLIGDSKFSLQNYRDFVYAGQKLDLSEFNPWKNNQEVVGSARFATHRIRKYR